MHPNQRRLDGFIRSCLERARTGPEEAATVLRRNARHVENQLRALSAWAASDDGCDAPAHLRGLTAFDLADALDRLRAAGG